ncbi:tetratricopeptide repeat protein (plasmid) [Rhizobium leguminosarum]
MAGGMRRLRAPLKKRVLIRRRTSAPATKLGLWERISDIAATIKKAVLGITGTIVFICFVILIYRAVTTPTITILPITVPKELVDRGYTPEALALQLRDQLLYLVKEAKSGKPAAQIVSSAEFSTINVPQTGMSLEMIASEIRKSFGTAKSSEISGGLERVGEAYNLRLLLERNGSFEILEPGADNDIKKVMLVAAERILETVDPYLLASVYLESDPDRATELADHIIYTAPERDPIIAWAHILKSAIYYNARNPSAALTEATTATELAPRNSVARLNQGSALIDLKRENEAIAALKESIALDPTDARPHIMLGTVLKSKTIGKLDAAISEFKTAVKLGHDNAMAHLALANGLNVRGQDREEAINEFRKSIEFGGDSARAHFSLATLLCERPSSHENIDEAIKHFQRAISIEPYNIRFKDVLKCAQNFKAQQIDSTSYGRTVTRGGSCICTN